MSDRITDRVAMAGSQQAYDAARAMHAEARKLLAEAARITAEAEAMERTGALLWAAALRRQVPA